MIHKYYEVTKDEQKLKLVNINVEPSKAVLLQVVLTYQIYFENNYGSLAESCCWFVAVDLCDLNSFFNLN
jgi:hypothetical protein